MKKNRFSRCHTLFAMLAIQRCQVNYESINEMKFTSMVMKELAKKEFGIKSLKELDTSKKVKEFEVFLEKKIYEKSLSKGKGD